MRELIGLKVAAALAAMFHPPRWRVATDVADKMNAPYS
jgi:hypothetical protein